MVSEDSNTPDGGTPAGAAPNGPAVNPTPASPERRGITVRRAPKFVPFLVLGGVVGIVAAAFVAYGIPGDASFDTGAVFGFFLVAFAAGGVLLGAMAALILDRVSVRRSQRAVVESVPKSTSVPNSTEDDAEA